MIHLTHIQRIIANRLNSGNACRGSNRRRRKLKHYLLTVIDEVAKM